MDLYKQFFRPLLFRLDPETAHRMRQSLLRRPVLVRRFARDHAIDCLKRRKRTSAALIVNLNSETFDEYLATFDALQSFGDAMEVARSCPNRPADAGDYLHPDGAAKLLAELVRRKQKPLFIKVPGYVDEDERAKRLDLVRCIKGFPVDGITISPGSRVKDVRLSIGRGTLTGRPLLPQTLRVIGDVYHLVGNELAIKASGGVQTAEDAYRAIAAGATSVELLTGFIYEGWRIAQNINRGLVERMDRHGIKDAGELRGQGAGKRET
jgi:dihydroorotate dehydrogenase